MVSPAAPFPFIKGRKKGKSTAQKKFFKILRKYFREIRIRKIEFIPLHPLLVRAMLKQCGIRTVVHD